MFDFRYHIISLVAVFLALGVGIVMGTMVVEKGVVADQQKTLIAKIEKDFQTLRQENAVANEKLAAADAFQKAMIPYTVNGKLSGQNVDVVITTTAIDNASRDALVDTLNKSGVRQVSVVTLSPDFNISNKDNADKVAAVLNAPGTSGDALKDRLMSEIGKELVTMQNPKLIEDLKALGVIKVSGPLDQAAQSVIVVGGSASEPQTDHVDAQLIKAMSVFNVNIAGVETTSVKNTYIPAYQKLGISTVDDIDLPAGLVSTVLSLSGQAGNYGVKSTAKQLMPSRP